MIRNLALLLVVSVCGCRALSTVETLASDPNFSSLVSALTQAGLIDTLNQGVFTIFAPSNFYFETLKYIDPHGLLTDAALFKSVLLYHVVAGRVMRANMTNEHTVTSVQGKPIRFNTYQHNHVTTAQGYQIIFFDKTADNGVIHVITNIMMPPKGDIVNIVSNDNETSTLLSFAVTAGIVGALQGDGLTLLAPTNAAFSQLPNATLSQLTGNVALLTEVLKYHVVPHTEHLVGLFDGARLHTLDGNEIISVHMNITWDSVRFNSKSHMTKRESAATNGVVYYIDTVLIPKRHANIVG
ncbi:transforming growth factor-beta-induced protein ig-h3-like [Dreissena polymorpha]|uniref:FAS1 domain-containing protein n=1 Tax=Dreissena polymorpha TaxID=45954 RepID=A0A9D4LI44_DREPO|nr:transforming growth factor-beta-induced protein ig-h3-like [Dreissena polymorpha]KAH3858189.1 hypothetical protein DPMN_100809 [Dreissena polymorpha]